jgi:U3 small nucleolar RNA-associated protein 25
LISDTPRDQGFTRPKVLILAPFKNSALNIVEKIIHLSGALQFDKKKRFQDEYGLAPEQEVIDSKKPGRF